MSLPPTLNFAKVEEEIFEIWKKNKAFETQDRLSKERGDKVSTSYHIMKKNQNRDITIIYCN